MSKRNISNILILSLLIIYIFVYQFYLLGNLLRYVEFITAVFLLGITFLAIVLLSFRREKETFLKKQIVKTTLIFIMMFFALSYVSGLFLGFLKNSYSLRLNAIIDNIFAPIVIIICTEILRYTLIRANKDKKYVVVILTIVLALLEVFTSVRLNQFTSLAKAFKVITSQVLPIIVKNCVLSYLSYEAGYKPCLIYRLVMDIYLFIMPIVPDLGDYLTSMVGICLPLLLYVYVSRLTDVYYNGVQYEFKRKAFHWTDVPIILFIVVLACLISGYFPYYIMGIKTGSMSPKINKGDAVLTCEVDKDEIAIGDVIAFEHGGMTIVHRVVEINIDKGSVYYKTKGDANNTADNFVVELDDIVGEVKLRIPYLGYPSVLFTELLQEE